MNFSNLGRPSARLQNTTSSYGQLNSPTGRISTTRFPHLPPMLDSSGMSSPVVNPAISMVRCDKSMCQYCGVSYLTISEMRALQATVKEQEQRLAQTKEIQQENVRLKETLTNIRKTHVAELLKQEEIAQRARARCVAVESQLNAIKQDLQNNARNDTDIFEKYAIASEDSKQQEEVISQLREELEKKRDAEAENASLKLKLKAAEVAYQKITGNQLPVENVTLAADRISHPGRQQQQRVEYPHLRTSEKNLTASKSQGSDRGKGQGPGSPKLAAEVHDLRRQNASLLDRIRNLTEDNLNCQDMHSGLRDTVDKLKGENMRLHDETNGLRIQFEESLLNVENVEAKLQGQQSENQRLRSLSKELENQLRAAMEQNRAIKNSLDPKLVDQLQKSLMTLQRQYQQQKDDISKTRAEYEERLAAAQRETQMERERADSCLTSSFAEREEVEKRWEERWTRHQTSLNEQLDELKTNQEKTLITAKEHEQALQNEIKNLREKLEMSREAWEKHQKSLNDLIAQWKSKHDSIAQEFESQRVAKVEVEVLYQTRTAELDQLREIVRDGCEERQELQKRLENMEENFEEVRLQTGTTVGRSVRSTARTSAAFGDSEGESSGYTSFSEVKNKIKPGSQLTSIRLKTSTSEGHIPGGSGSQQVPQPGKPPQPVRSHHHHRSKAVPDMMDPVFTIGKGKVSTAGSRSTSIGKKKKKLDSGRNSEMETTSKTKK